MSGNILSELVIQKIYGASRIHAKTNVVTTRKNRNCWAVAIKTTGKTEYTCGEKKIISDIENIVVLPKGATYMWQSFGGECLMIDFEAGAEAEEIYSFNINDNKKIVNLFNVIENNRISRDDNYKIKSIEALYRIVIVLLEAQKSRYIPSKTKTLIEPAVNYITENYNNSEINIKMLSELAGVSYVYFRKIFSEVYSCPPMEYIQRLRMNKAAEMLKSDYNSIETIAQSVGYSSVYHFSKMFKLHFGISPSRYGKING